MINKRCISAILILIMVIGMLPITASAETSGTCGENVNWTYDEATATLTISGTGPMEDYSFGSKLPWRNYVESIKTVTVGNGVETIGNYVFYGCKELTRVAIPESVISIGNYAFANCKKLLEVNIPREVTFIGEEAFYNCSSLTRITIPDGVTNIEPYTFENCTSLTEVTLPEGFESIGDSAFCYCISLETINLPESLTYIGDHSFMESESLTELYISSNITYIGYQSLWGSSAQITVSAGNPDFASQDGVLFNKEKTTLIFCPTSKTGEYIIPDSVNYIDEYAFIGCDLLTNLYVHENVYDFGDEAFAYCSAYFIVDDENENFCSDSGILFDKSKTELLSCPTSTEGEFTIPEGVTTIGVAAFEGCELITDIIIPESVTCIEDSAFDSCEAIESIIIPESVEDMGAYLFYGCDSLANVTLPQNLTYIGESMFEKCTSLVSISIPESVTSIGDCAFCKCTSLKNVNIPEGVTEIGWDLFYMCTSLTNIVIPDSVTQIGGMAFSWCTSLSSIVIPDGVTIIEFEGFRGCESLTTVTIPHSVEYIIDSAFENCNLETVNVPCDWDGSIYDFDEAVLNRSVHLDDDNNQICDICDAVIESQTDEGEFAILGYDSQKVTVVIPKAGTYSVIIADYEGEKLVNIEVATVTITEATAGTATDVPRTKSFSLGTDDKIILWSGMTSFIPLCDAYIVE